MEIHIKKTGSHAFFGGLLICHIVLLISFNPVAIEASEWEAGVASVTVTPEESVWMAGYGGRKKPSEGKIHDLHVKALALEGPGSNRIVIITADLIGFSREFSNNISKEIRKRFGLPREALFFNASHTHCGPVIRLPKIPVYKMPEEYVVKAHHYIEWLEKRVIRVISEALNNMKPAELSFSSITPTPFAVCRRFPTPEGIVYRSSPSSYYTSGPRDDVVPVLKVTDPAGNIKAILFGYACHPITLNIYQFCGDYPGFAQQYIEEAYPGATALFVQGCAGQLVPNARYQIEYAMGHGRALAVAVTKALDGEQIPISGPLISAYDEIALDVQPIPEREVLEKDLKSDNSSTSEQAAFLLEKLNNNETIETSVPCPLQVVHFGKELLLIGLCGEPVVEYSLKLKSEYMTYQFVWVSGYSNDEVYYLPTWKILREGGYEAQGARVGTPQPIPFSETVEERVLEGVRRLVKNVSAGR